MEYPHSQTWVDAETVANETEVRKDKGQYVGVEDDMLEDEQFDDNCDGLADIWTEMTFALECSKVISLYISNSILL